jgi:DNA-binding transcriptional regulator YiaG
VRLVPSPEQREEELRRSSLRIQAIRRQLGMTQLEMAYFLGVTVETIRQWEHGGHKPSRLAELGIRHMCAEHGLDLNRMRRFAV